jgi:Zn-dependent peptidase ImmA (M78 family)
MVTRVSADRGVLKWARLRNQLTVERAATLLKCQADFLQKIEDGIATPTATLFRRMAEIYFVPEATLLGLAMPQERPLPKDFRSFDGAKVELSYETIAAIRRVEARQESLSYLAELDESVVAPNLPIHSIKENPEKLGSDFRQQLGFPILDQLRLTPDQAFIRWRILVEGLGVAVYIEDLGEDDSRGISIFFNDFPAIVVDQNEKLAGAKAFTLFHELGHLLIRQSGISNFNSRNAVESFCNKFSAAFLLPIEAIEAAFAASALDTEPTIAELSAAARKLCVTISQLALRLEEIGRAKKGFYNRISKVLSPPIPKTRRLNERPPYKYVYTSRYGHHLPETVFGSLERGVITPTQAARILELSPNHFEPIRKVVRDRRPNEEAREHVQ